MAGLLVKHFIFDFPLQTQKMVEEKGIYLKEGGLEHSYLHAFGTFVVLLLAGFQMDIALLASTIDFSFHYHIDYWKSKLCKKFKLTPENKWFWSALGFDQLLHGLTYILIIHFVLSN